MRAVVAISVLLALATCSPTVAPPTSEQFRGAISGQLQPLGYFYYVNADCSSMGNGRIRIVKPPSDGEITTAQGEQPIAFGKDNARAVCNGKMTPAMFVRYQSKPGYVGEDKATIEVVGPYGADSLIEYTLNVH
jgi:hypothetical protein